MNVRVRARAEQREDLRTAAPLLPLWRDDSDPLRETCHYTCKHKPIHTHTRTHGTAHVALREHRYVLVISQMVVGP